MVLLNKVIQILALPDGNAFLVRFVGIECDQSGDIGATFIDRHHFRFIDRNLKHKKIKKNRHVTDVFSTPLVPHMNGTDD